MPITSHKEFGAEGVMLADVIEVRQRFLRSVNLEHDYAGSDPLNGYLPTTSSLTALERLAESIQHPHARAFSITGPYGSGKSAFALFASKALAPQEASDGSPRALALRQQPMLHNRLFADDSEGFLPIHITGGRVPAAWALLHGLLDALARCQQEGVSRVVRALRREFRAILSAELPSSSDVARVFAAASEKVLKTLSETRGLLVVVDEMGKFLEHAALHPEQGDLQVFQDLAEYAARSAAAPLVLVTILHQAFEEYAYRLSATQRREWQKVQGRFIDIPFGDGPEENIRLIAQAIRHKEPIAGHPRLEQTLDQNMDWCRRLSLFPPTLSAAEFRAILRDTYPLHPLTLRLLPHAFRRFGQNERSLFSFLSADEPYGFQDFLRTQTLTAERAPALRVDHLYDYIVQTLSSTIYAHTTSKLWSETEEAVHRLRDQKPLHSRLVKSIGLLHILGEQTRILPSKETLLFALTDEETGSQEIEVALGDLMTATLITYRQFKQAYRLYEGSDIDIDARLREARAHFAQGTDSVRAASQLGVTPPVVARQHSYRTGTLRIFEVRYCRPASLEMEIRQGRGQGDGALLLCLASDREELAQVEQIANSLLPAHPEVIVGASVETEALHEAAVAVDSLLWVLEETPELRTDRVAAREVRERLAEATNAFREEWERLLHPRDMAEEGGAWYHLGDRVAIPSRRQLQAFISQACDAAYPATPILHNELVNRRQLSSTAAAARRNLIEAMITRRVERRLGIEGFPPEASMYVSVLENTGIHCQVSADRWDILPPNSESNSALVQIWNEIEAFLFSDDLDMRPLTLLNTCLRGKPYGLTEGIIPILQCAVLLYNEKEVALYEDGRFIVELDSATFERMIKRPGDFKLRGCRITGERQAVLDRFARGLLDQNEEPTIINVVRKLYREFNRLPEYTSRTRRLDDEARALRDAFKESREPEQLLFVDLPRLLGSRPFTEIETDSANVSTFFEKWNVTMSAIIGAYKELLRFIEHELCTAFDVENWLELRTRADAAQHYVTEPRLRTFVVRSSDETLSREKWIESVAAGVIGRPPSAWSDSDVDRFSNMLPPLATALQHSELLHFEKHRRNVGDEQIAMRLAVTQETGEEEARAILISKTDMDHIQQLATSLRLTCEPILQSQPADVRLAVIAQMIQEILRGDQDE